MPLNPYSKANFAKKAEQPKSPFEAVLTLPYDGETGIIDIPVAHVTNILYRHVSKEKRKEFGTNETEIMSIKVYFRDSHSYFDMDPRLMRAMHRKAREGYDVDFRTFYDVFPEERLADKVGLPVRNEQSSKPAGKVELPGRNGPRPGY